jgi:hypothetical protein
VKSSCSRAGLAVDAAASAREVRAGRVVPVSPRLRADDGAVRLRLARKFPAPSTGLEKLRRHGGPCVRQNRVVLAVVATVKSCEGASEPNRADCIIQIRGAREARRNGRLPGDHGISRPAIAQGRPSDRRHLYAAVRSILAHYSRSGPRVPAGTRPSLRPLGSEGSETKAKLGRNPPRDCEGVSANHKLDLVGWAKRSVPTSLLLIEGDRGHGAQAPLPTLRHCIADRQILPGRICRNDGAALRNSR